MRARRHRSSSGSAILLGPIVAAALGALAVAAPGCADALHLDPPEGATNTVGSSSSTGTSGSSSASSGSSASSATVGSSSSTSTSSSSGAGGADAGHPDAGEDSGKPGCKSNADCAYPDPICDTVTESCVECLVLSDCAGKPSTVCSLAKCVCPDPTNTYCPGANCVDTSTSAQNCGACGNTCFGNCDSSSCGNAWLAIPSSLPGTPSPRSLHAAAWTGTEMFIWGGDQGGTPLADGALFSPKTRTWRAVSKVGAPSPRWSATAVWDDVDNKVIVWGGTTSSGQPQDGGIYDPATDTWTPTDTSSNLPPGRDGQTELWVHTLTGFPGHTSGLLIFAGQQDGNPTIYLSDGEVFDPAANMWIGQLAPPPGSFSPRSLHVGTWDGAQLFVFGGQIFDMPPAPPVAAGDAYLLNPLTMAWTVLPQPPIAARWGATGLYDAVSQQTVVWGGTDGNDYFSDGAFFNAAQSSWSPFGTTTGRINHSSAILVPTAGTSQLVVFGGNNGGVVLTAGAVLNIQTSTWSDIPGAQPDARQNHSVVTAGADTMIIWGGTDASGNERADGAIYTGQ